MKFTSIETRLILLGLKDLQKFYTDLTQNTVIKDDRELTTYYHNEIAKIDKLIDKIEKGE